MMSEFGELTLLAVDRFWRRARKCSKVASPALESALRNLTEGGTTKQSKAWAAVLLSVACIEQNLLEQAATSLATNDAVFQYPPDQLMRRIGFAFASGQCVALSEVGNAGDSFHDLLPKVRSLSFLNNQSVAEIALALAGTKVSRLVLSGPDLAALSKAINYPVFVSAIACDAVVDHELGGFSNIATRDRFLESVEPTDQLYVYFGGLIEDRALVAVMDSLNAAGEFLGIPECCRELFRTSWDDIRERAAGDMAFDLFSRASGGKMEGELRVAWQCNPYGMYRGGGLLWHFPCSVDCSQTIALVNDRLDLLKVVDPDLSAECRNYQTSSFWLQSDRQIKRTSPDAPALFVNPI